MKPHQNVERVRLYSVWWILLDSQKTGNFPRFFFLFLVLSAHWPCCCVFLLNSIACACLWRLLRRNKNKIPKRNVRFSLLVKLLPFNLKVCFLYRSPLQSLIFMAGSFAAATWNYWKFVTFTVVSAMFVLTNDSANVFLSIVCYMLWYIDQNILMNLLNATWILSATSMYHWFWSYIFNHESDSERFFPLINNECQGFRWMHKTWDKTTKKRIKVFLIFFSRRGSPPQIDCIYSIFL